MAGGCSLDGLQRLLEGVELEDSLKGGTGEVTDIEDGGTNQ